MLLDRDVWLTHHAFAAHGERTHGMPTIHRWAARHSRLIGRVALGGAGKDLEHAQQAGPLDKGAQDNV